MHLDWMTAAGVQHYSTIDPQDIPFEPEIRRICEGNTCRHYGKSWACPPAVGTLAECRAQCLRFPAAVVFCNSYPLEDAFDYEGMRAGHRAFQQLCDRLYEPIHARYPRFLLLSNEGCIRCPVCTYPGAPCRMPQRLFPSIEGYGIHVGKLAALAHLPYVGRPNTVTYFGMLLHDTRQL